MGVDRESIVGRIRELKGRKLKAILGKGDSSETVAVPGKAGYVWIRPKYGSEEGPPVHALNRAVPLIHGRVVDIQEIKAKGIKGYEVIGFARGALYYTDPSEGAELPPHGWTHEFRQDGIGSDPVNLYTRGWAELRVQPVDPAALYCYVTRGWYMFDVPTWYAGGYTPVFSPPAAGRRYDLVYIDSSGTINIEEGDIGGFEGPSIPEPPDYTIPLAAVYFTGSIGGVTEDLIFDCRVMPNVKYGAGNVIFDDSITPSVIYPDVGSWSGDDDYAARADHRHGITAGTPSSVGSANAEGTSTEFVRRDHVHQGVHSLSEAGQAQLFGDVTLSEGANVTLTQAGQDIEIASAAAAVPVHQHDGPLATQGGDVLNPFTLYVTGTATFADGTYVDHIDEITFGHGVVIDSVQMKDNTVNALSGIFSSTVIVNHILEDTIGHGVDIDGVLCKDSDITADDGLFTDDVVIQDHCWMATGTCAGDFQVGGTLTRGDDEILAIDIADKDGDGDFEPYTSGDWYGDSFSTGVGTINWQADFGLPERPKLVFVEVWVRDSASTADTYSLRLFAKNTTAEPSLTCRAPRGVDNETGQNAGCVAVAADGTSYYTITASGANTFDVWIRVVAWVS